MKNDAKLRAENPNWYQNGNFLPTLLEEIEKYNNDIFKAPENIKNENHLAIYREKFSSMTVDQRINEATLQTGALLFALCHDPDTRVIKKILENHSSGLEHARLIAKFHKNSQGLEFICRNAQLLHDLNVQANLLKNSFITEYQLRMILNSKTLMQSWNIANSRDYPDTNRQNARKILKEKFLRAQPEEKTAFIYDTEGRVLILLHDIPFCQKTTELLCKRTYFSYLLISNLAKCSKTPSDLLRHLIVQNIVKRNEPLKQLIRRHANYPKSFSRNRKK